MGRKHVTQGAIDERARQRRAVVQAQRNATNREMAAARKAAGLTYHAGKRGTQIEADWRRQMAAIPDDTRDLTARICGDPLPGRSALDMARACS
jgi:hypothetical protein